MLRSLAKDIITDTVPSTPCREDRIDRPPGRQARTLRVRPCAVAAGMAAAALCACASFPPYSATGPLLVSLPIGAVGVRDQRLAFAPYFQQELDQAARGGAERPNAWSWLHAPPSVQPASAPEGSTAPMPVPEPPPAAPGAPLARVAVLLVPGLFGDCVDTQSVPFGDGIVRDREESYTAAYAPYADLGLADIRALKILGRAGSDRNGALIETELLAEAARTDVDSIVLVAYSKGAPDALHALSALQHAHRLPAKVKALVSASGAVMGTPIADEHASAYAALAGLMEIGGCPKSEGGEIESLTRRVQGAWLAQAVPLPDIAYYSLTAHAPREEIARGLVMFYDDLSHLDARNDGQVIAAEAILPRSELIGEARSDHWNFVLPMARYPSALIGGMASPVEYPRVALLRAVVRYVADDLDGRVARGQETGAGAYQR
jgi:hypothetical protein